jgi:hypothetical protein
MQLLLKTYKLTGPAYAKVIKQFDVKINTEIDNGTYSISPILKSQLYYFKDNLTIWYDINQTEFSYIFNNYTIRIFLIEKDVTLFVYREPPFLSKGLFKMFAQIYTKLKTIRKLPDVR